MLRSSATKFSVIVVYVVLAQILGKYYSRPFILFSSFDLLKFMVVLLAPFAINQFYLKWSWTDLGLAWPNLKISKGKLIALSIGVFLIAPFLIREILQSSETYLGYYNTYRQTAVPLADRFWIFGVFTLSTLIGWEILHRSFLLFGLRKIWAEQMDVRMAEQSAILVVMGFEVLYHLLKPSFEAWGMLVFSPFLSVIAFRTRSVLLPLLIHLFVEFVFFWSITS